MTSICISDAHDRLSELVEHAGRGQEFLITRRGHPIARLVLADAPNPGARAEQLAVGIRRGRVGRSFAAPATFGDLINESRS